MRKERFSPIGSIKTIFGKKKKRAYHFHKPQLEPAYGDIYFNERLYKGIVDVAKSKGITIRQAAEELMTTGLSQFIGGKLAEHI